MIPDLGIAVCVYMIWRIIEILIAGTKRYSSKAAHVVAFSLGIIAIVVISLCGFSLLIAGATSTNPLAR